MTFPVVGSNIPGSYQISNSLRFNRGDSPYLSRSLSSTSTTWTFSTWVKRSTLGNGNVSTTNYLISWGNSGTDATGIQFNRDNEFAYYSESSPDNKYKTTSGVYRDTSAWYHLICQCSSNTITLYVNGEEPTQSWVVGSSANPLDTSTMNIGKWVTSAYYHDGYMAETYFIEGQALSPTDFGEFDEDSGVWKPKQYAGTYGTNGFYLKFNNTGNIGEDSSGNDNTFTPVNLSGTTDVTTDTPTNNFATLNALSLNTSNVLSQGNLKSTHNYASGWEVQPINWIPSSGKWYMECYLLTAGGGSDRAGVGLVSKNLQIPNTNVTGANSALVWSYYRHTSSFYNNGSSSGTASTYGVGDIVQILFDADTGSLYFKLNNVDQNSGNYAYTGLSDVFMQVEGYSGAEWVVNLGQDSSFADATTRQNNSDENGYGDFYYAPPSGYLALCTQNLATALSPTIDDASYYFDTTLHTGNNGSGRTFTGLNFQPDWIWGKVRDSSNYTPFSVDSSRGGDKFLTTSSTAAEDPGSHGEVSSFNSDGSTWIDGSNATYPRLYYNDGSGSTLGGSTYVFWQWKANGGTTSSNTDGSITSTVQANTTAGFSIVTYTGTGANGTIGHGLGKTPEWIMTKRRDTTGEWMVYQKSFSEDGSGEFNLMNLNDTDASQEFGAYNFMQSTSPTSSVFYIDGQTEMNGSGGTFVAYCFAPIEGYSKFGSYTGNGSSDGTFVYTGFRPAFVMIKGTNVAQGWWMFDNKRVGYNVDNNLIQAEGPGAENTSDWVDILSNGFKPRSSDPGLNGSYNYIYMAFAENPFVTSGAVPVTAR